MPRRNNRFTIYDAMEARGVFEANPHNSDARDANGQNVYVKAEFPRMVFHPEGLERISQPGEILATPLGPRKVGEQKQLIDKTVKTQAELDAALADGWHLTPQAAVAIRTGEALPKTQQETIGELEAKIAALELERNSRNEQELAGAEAAGAIVSRRNTGAEP